MEQQQELWASREAHLGKSRLPAYPSVICLHTWVQQPCPGAAHSLTARGQLSLEPWSGRECCWGCLVQGERGLLPGEGGLARTHPQLFSSPASGPQPVSLPLRLHPIPWVRLLTKAGQRDGLCHLLGNPRVVRTQTQKPPARPLLCS